MNEHNSFQPLIPFKAKNEQKQNKTKRNNNIEKPPVNKQSLPFFLGAITFLKIGKKLKWYRCLISN
jgi:hypothetical protein